MTESQTPTSKGITSGKSKEACLDNNLGEELEVQVIKGLKDTLQSLPMALQQRAIEWTENFIDIRDKIQCKQHYLKNIQSLIISPKSKLINFELRASERAKEVHKKEYHQLYTAVKDAKHEVSDLFTKSITKASDWETPITKLVIIE